MLQRDCLQRVVLGLVADEDRLGGRAEECRQIGDRLDFVVHRDGDVAVELAEEVDVRVLAEGRRNLLTTHRIDGDSSVGSGACDSQRDGHGENDRTGVRLHRVFLRFGLVGGASIAIDCVGLASSRVDTSFRRYSLCYSLPSD